MSAQPLIGTMQIRVRIDFGSGPVDVTDDGMVASGVKITRGIPDESTRTTPATMSLVLKNTSGNYTPDYRGSIYWPGVKLRAPITVDVSFDGSTWIPRFSGGVDEWPQGFPGQTAAYMESMLSASGVLRQYGQGTGTTLGSSIAAEITDDNFFTAFRPFMWWPLDDGKEATFAANRIDFSKPLTLPHLYIPAAVEGPPGDSSLFATLPAISGSPTTAEFARWEGTGTAVARTIEIWTNDLTSLEVQAYFSAAAFQDFFTVHGVATNGIAASIVTADGGPSVSNAGPLAAVSGWWHVVAALTEVTAPLYNLDVYVNNVNVASGAGNLDSPLGFCTAVYLYNRTVGGNPAACAHLAVYDNNVAMGAPTVADHYNAGLGWIGETAGDRHERVAAAVGIATSGTNVALTTMGTQPNKVALDLLAEGATAEWAPIIETRTGKLDLHARSERYTKTPALTIDGHLFADLQSAYDDKDTCNTGTATRTNGSTTTSEDTTRSAAPPTGEGSYPKTLEVDIDTDTPLPNYAGWLIATGIPQTRYPAIPIRYTSTMLTQLASWCAVELNQLVEITNLPATLPLTTFDGFLEAYTETWTFAYCDVSLTLAPGVPWTTAFTLEDNPLGRLGFRGQTVNANASIGATSISVATSGTNALISTAGGDFPMDLNINGYKVTASACSGSSSPQTLTVTALAHAITSGMGVDLWTQPVLVL